MLKSHLVLAESQVTLDERVIADQCLVIEKLEATGEVAAAARELLQTLEEEQRLHVADRDRLKAELAKLS